ncbi:TauD/TfdA family dioxygenase [Lysobacter sp. BMK333-48F3]|uniref:TauD/TfdA family dioxygenase n=1 Tax=Lysobacter sp. BMK333-48F3 TaxID=2867962 RepID=UPI001C8BA280|nr:TauD/TfdA family dioxygenase [Lysobacter sp. BMK333-48F3]MBX9403192.1 TauD/TfdA family dioxygenase [Lysobacter sp. BMK333-48F3]
MKITSAKREALAPWIRQNRQIIDDALWDDGYVLFRGFDVGGLDGFEESAASACDSLYKHYGDLPLASASENVYFATPYPKHLEIQFHNEASHTHTWPSRQLFFCLEPAPEGGEWTLSDGRRVIERLPAQMLERFRELGLVYRRRFIRGLDASWEQFFKVGSLQELRDKISPTGHEIDAPSENDVTVSYRTHALLHIPERGTEAWFNQILLHHPDALPAEVDSLLRKHFQRDQFPRTVFFGDGSPIPAEWVRTIDRVLSECSVRIQTQTHDVLLVNNLLLAHGRLPYSGNRQIRVALGDMRDHAVASAAASAA